MAVNLLYKLPKTYIKDGIQYNTQTNQRMKQIVNEFLASAIVNGNEVRLVTRNNRYFIHWGEEGRVKAEQELTTPTGRKPSQASAHKKFLEVVESTRYLKFSKL